MAKENNWTTSTFSEVLGLSLEDVENYLRSIGITSQQIIDWNLRANYLNKYEINLSEINFSAVCPICKQEKNFSAEDDFWSCRESLKSSDCSFHGCSTRDRAISKAIFSLYTEQELQHLNIHEAAPSGRGLTVWLKEYCSNYIQTGYFPTEKFGDMHGYLRNENLEHQTFDNEQFDIVIHLDILEHLFQPFTALNEIYRTLKPGGRCIFTAPTYSTQFESLQVAFLEESGDIKLEGVAEYHGNPQASDEGSLVTWQYGYDLPYLIGRKTLFDVEVRRWYSKSDAIMGGMTEVYILNKI